MFGCVGGVLLSKVVYDYSRLQKYQYIVCIILRAELEFIAIHENANFCTHQLHGKIITDELTCMFGNLRH